MFIFRQLHQRANKLFGSVVRALDFHLSGPGSNPLEGEKNFQLCIINLLWLSCHKNLELCKMNEVFKILGH